MHSQVAIVDIDGTLADLTHRRHYVAQKPKNWNAFHIAADRDTVIEPVAAVVRSLRLQGWTIVLCSGRPEGSRDLTEKWMLANHIFYDHLFMRPNNDFRPDDIVKSELLDRILALGLKPVIAFDDRSRVVALWRSRNIICAQVAPGDF